MPSTRAVLSQIFSSLRPAHGAMLTWSSCPAEVGRLSTEAGCAYVLFSETSAAAVTCAIMKPDSRPGLRREEHVQVRVHAAVEQVDAPLRRARELRDGDREEVADEAERLGVEIAARQHVLAEDQRIVGDAVERGREHVARVTQRVLDRAVDLRHAAHGIRILHALAVLVAARISLSRDSRLRRRARDLDLALAGGSRAGCARRTGHGCRRGLRPSCAQQTTAASSRRSARNSPSSASARLKLRAIQQREAFLRLQFEWRDARGLHDLGAACRLTLPVADGRCSGFAFADQRQGEVRERREIARRADRALRRNRPAARRH